MDYYYAFKNNDMEFSDKWNVEGHWRAGIETYCNENFLKYMKAILMRLPNNEVSPNWSSVVTKQSFQYRD